MKSRQVGQTSLAVTSLGLGTAPLGWAHRPISETEAIQTVQAALTNGVRFFDTAPSYGREGERYSEMRLGMGLAQADIPRHHYVIATKAGLYPLLKGEGAEHDLSLERIKRGLDSSLKRLQTDYVDIVHIHEPEAQSLAAMEKAFQELADWRRQGVIRAIGAGMNQWSIIHDLLQFGDFDCFLIAGRYTLLEQGGLAIYDECLARGISIFAAGVFNSGLLTSETQAIDRYNYRPAPPDILTRARQLAAVCQHHNVPMIAAALQLPMAHPAVTSLVFGAAAPQEIEANLAALEEIIPNDFWIELRHEGLLHPNAPVPEIA